MSKVRLAQTNGLLAILILLTGAAALSIFPFIWGGSDWLAFYRAGALDLADPYSTAGNYAPPWVFALLWPLAILPDVLQPGAVILAILATVALYLKDRTRFLFALVSMPVLINVAFGQVDFLSVLALMAPIWIAPVLFTCKPQGAALAILRRLDRRGILLLLAVVGASFVLWGFWPTAMLPATGQHHNVSVWPYGLPLGAALLFWQWRRGFDSDAALCLATLLVMPYYSHVSTLPVVLAGIKESESKRAMLAVVLLSWAAAFAFPVGWKHSFLPPL